MKILVAGSREYNSQEIVDRIKYHIDQLYPELSVPHEPVTYTVLTGGEKGCARIASDYFGELGVDVVTIKPDSLVARHRPFDERDFFTRNEQLVQNCDVALLFWDGVSKEVQDIERRMRRLGKHYQIINILDEVE